MRDPCNVEILLKSRRADGAIYGVDIKTRMAAIMHLLRSALNTLWNGLTQISNNCLSTSSDLQELTLQSGSDAMPIIAYAYNPWPTLPASTNKQLFYFHHRGQVKNPFLTANSVELNPLLAKLPYRSSIGYVHASRHWDANLDATTQILKLLAADTSVTDMEVRGITIGKLARKSLEPGFEHSMVLATHYMFPAGDKHRTALIAVLMIVFFIFDDKAEETDDKTLHLFQQDFLRRLEGPSRSDPPSTPLQRYLDDVVRGIESEDEAGGNGGKDMLNELRNAFRSIDPGKIHNVDGYLEFRRYDAGSMFCVAAAKFSVKSETPLDHPRYSRFLKSFCNHLGLMNDLASYDKEVRALELRGVGQMINVVDAVKKATCLQSTEDAKTVTWMLQIQFEKEMMDEFDTLLAQGLSDDDRWFLEAVLACAVGNIMYSTTTTRYGGEAAKLGKSHKSSELLV
ncbi:MAG: hypothetical protein Q9203_002268 [Teloschistes exilis]